MALLKPNGEYISIVKGAVTPDCIPYIIHKDKNQRKRLKEGTMDCFEQVVRTHLFTPVSFSIVADPSKSIEDNIVTEAYRVMGAYKNEETGEDFTDCMEV